MEMGEVRLPYAAGYFYPMDRELLIKEIEDCFLNKKFGPGKLPEKGEVYSKVLGGIVPHAGYKYSGAIAAHFYLALAKSRQIPDTIVILGTNHSGLGDNISISLQKRWWTPLGNVEVDIEFGRKLIEHLDIKEDRLAHINEHSIEVQLPFLQYTYQNLGKEFKIVPIVLKDLELEEIKEVSKAIFEVEKLLGRPITVIASSDFTHYGAIYGYVPFTENVEENMHKLDMIFIRKILKLDTKGFLKEIDEKFATVCGYIPIATLLEYVKFKGNVKSELLKYTTSGDITGDWSISVGYASVLFYI